MSVHVLDPPNLSDISDICVNPLPLVKFLTFVFLCSAICGVISNKISVVEDREKGTPTLVPSSQCCPILYHATHAVPAGSVDACCLVHVVGFCVHNVIAPTSLL